MSKAAIYVIVGSGTRRGQSMRPHGEICLGVDRPIVEWCLLDDMRVQFIVLSSYRLIVWPNEDADEPCHVTIAAGVEKGRLREIATEASRAHPFDDPEWQWQNAKRMRHCNSCHEDYEYFGEPGGCCCLVKEKISEWRGELDALPTRGVA